jgi:hypothetical protein
MKTGASRGGWRVSPKKRMDTSRKIQVGIGVSEIGKSVSAFSAFGTGVPKSLLAN